MNCENSQRCMIDILYGEETDARQCFKFFDHLNRCSECQGEYLELLDTREQLGQWEITGQSDLTTPDIPYATTFQHGRPWWPFLQKTAAGFLIAIGIFSILQFMGLLGGQRLVVPERQLTQMVHDMIVDQQLNEREMMLRVLLQVKEDVELQQQNGVDQLQRYVISLEQRYVDNLEENNRYLQVLLSR